MLTQQDRQFHLLYEAMSDEDRAAIDSAYTALRISLCEEVHGFKPDNADAAECLVGAIARYVDESRTNAKPRTLTQRLAASLRESIPPMPHADAMCHAGICPQEKCGNCQRIARAWAAIKEAEAQG